MDLDFSDFLCQQILQIYNSKSDNVMHGIPPHTGNSIQCHANRTHYLSHCLHYATLFCMSYFVGDEDLSS